jgi:hypothetical protein
MNAVKDGSFVSIGEVHTGFCQIKGNPEAGLPRRVAA